MERSSTHRGWIPRFPLLLSGLQLLPDHGRLALAAGVPAGRTAVHAAHTAPPVPAIVLVAVLVLELLLLLLLLVLLLVVLHLPHMVPRVVVRHGRHGAVGADVEVGLRRGAAQTMGEC